MFHVFSFHHMFVSSVYSSLSITYPMFMFHHILTLYRDWSSQYFSIIYYLSYLSYLPQHWTLCVLILMLIMQQSMKSVAKKYTHEANSTRYEANTAWHLRVNEDFIWIWIQWLIAIWWNVLLYMVTIGIQIHSFYSYIHPIYWFIYWSIHLSIC
jgi:hypothetical protein